MSTALHSRSRSTVARLSPAAGLLTASLLVMGVTPARAAKIDPRLTDPATFWTNQGGSTMTLIFNCQDVVCQLSGTYVNHEGGFHCQGTPYPLTGVYYVNTQTISWSIAWSNPYEDCASVTGWTGYLSLSANNLQFLTDWNLARSTGGNGREILQGHDTFTQNTTHTSRSLLKEPGSK